jgi:hypothetical protein
LDADALLEVSSSMFVNNSRRSFSFTWLWSCDFDKLQWIIIKSFFFIGIFFYFISNNNCR